MSLMHCHLCVSIDILGRLLTFQFFLKGCDIHMNIAGEKTYEDIVEDFLLVWEDTIVLWVL